METFVRSRKAVSPEAPLKRSGLTAGLQVCLRLRRQAAIRRPVHTLIPWWPSARTSALSSKTQNRCWRYRDCADWPVTLSPEQTRQKWQVALPPARGWLSLRMLPGVTHKCCYVLIPPHCRIPLPREPSATSLRHLIANASSSVVGLRRPGVLNITASCVHTGCFTVTLTASRIPHPARGCPRRVAVIAPARRHPRANCTARLELANATRTSRVCSTPKPPPIPDARPLPSPRGRRSKIVCSLRSLNGVAA